MMMVHLLRANHLYLVVDETLYFSGGIFKSIMRSVFVMLYFLKYVILSEAFFSNRSMQY